jgi:hypothetical protein
MIIDAADVVFTHRILANIAEIDAVAKLAQVIDLQTTQPFGPIMKLIGIKGCILWMPDINAGFGNLHPGVNDELHSFGFSVNLLVDQQSPTPNSVQPNLGELASAGEFLTSTKASPKYSGSNVNIAIIDNGLGCPDRVHPAFVGHLHNESHAVGFPDTYDDLHTGGTGHGTRVASIVSSEDQKIGKKSARIAIAPGAKIIVVKPFDRASRSEKNTTIALYLAITGNADIVSMSFEFPNNGGLGDYWLRLSSLAFQKGKMLIAAGGNVSQRSALPPVMRSIQTPASIAGMLAIGGLDNLSDFKLFVQSPQGSKNSPLAFVAPACPFVCWKADGSVGDISETSLACAIVAGLAALHLEELRSMQADPVSVVQLWQKMVSSRVLPKKHGPLPDPDLGQGKLVAPK